MESFTGKISKFPYLNTTIRFHMNEENNILKVKIDNLIYDVPYEDGITVIQLKKEIYKLFDVPTSRMKLIWKKKILPDDFSIEAKLFPKERSKRFKKDSLITVLGSKREIELKIGISDIISHSIIFLEIKDVRNLQFVCKKWKELADLGSRRNLDRYSFSPDGMGCVDLLKGKIIYQLNKPIDNVFNFECHYLSMKPYTGCKYALYETEDSKKRKVMDCLYVPRGKKVWSSLPFLELRPKVVSQKMKMQLNQRRRRRNNDDVNNDVQERLVHFRQLVDAVVEQTDPMEDEEDFVPQEPNPEDTLQVCLFDKSVNAVFLQFEHYIAKLDGDTGKFLRAFVPEVLKTNVLITLENPMSILSDFILVGSRDTIFVVEKKMMTCVNTFKPSISPSGRFVELHDKNRIFMIQPDLFVLLGADGSFIHEFSSNDFYIQKHIIAGEDGIVSINDQSNRAIQFLGSGKIFHIIGSNPEEPEGYLVLSRENNGIFSTSTLNLVGLYPEYKMEWKGRSKVLKKKLATGIIWKHQFPYEISSSKLTMDEENYYLAHELQLVEPMALTTTDNHQIMDQITRFQFDLMKKGVSTDTKYFRVSCISRDTGTCKWTDSYELPKKYPLTSILLRGDTLWVSHHLNNEGVIRVLNPFGICIYQEICKEDSFLPPFHIARMDF